jgi:hypothetical protein
MSRSRLNAGEELKQGEHLSLSDPKLFLYMQEDGNLVLYTSVEKIPKNAIWASHTVQAVIPELPALILKLVAVPGKAPFRLAMQKDNNLVIYDVNNKPLWSSGTNGKGNGEGYFEIRKDGKLVVCDRDNKTLWESAKEMQVAKLHVGLELLGTGNYGNQGIDKNPFAFAYYLDNEACHAELYAEVGGKVYRYQVKANGVDSPMIVEKRVALDKLPSGTVWIGSYRSDQPLDDLDQLSDSWRDQHDRYHFYGPNCRTYVEDVSNHLPSRQWPPDDKHYGSFLPYFQNKRNLRPRHAEEFYNNNKTKIDFSRAGYVAFSFTAVGRAIFGLRLVIKFLDLVN